MTDIKIFGDSMVRGLKAFMTEENHMVFVNGFPGFDVEKLVAELGSLKNKNFDIIVQIGTNNVFKHRINDRNMPKDEEFTDLTILMSKFLKLVEFLSKNFKNRRCFILPILPRGISSATNRRLVLINGEIKKILARFNDCNVKFGKISYAGFLAENFGVNPRLYRWDMLHLSEAGFEIFQNLIKNFAIPNTSPDILI